jgi:predicted acetyltransferase
VTRVTVRPLRTRDVPIVRRLVQLYLYDLVGARWGVEADGSYAPSRWHRRFWRRDGRRHFLVRVNGRPAGFALVREIASADGVPAREMSEFFVLRTYRRRGVGSRVARTLFNRFPGRWELSVLTWNVVARPFWRRVIRHAARGRVVLSQRRQGDLSSILWRFEAGARHRRVRRSGGR